MNSKIKKFNEHSNTLRKLILDVYLKNGGHLSTSFSCIEILVSLHFGGFLKISKKNYKSKNRNIFILSKGHAELAYYSLMYKLGVLSKKILYNELDSEKFLLGGHVDHKMPGVELTTGSLGHGLGFAAGISLAHKKNSKKYKQYVLLGDAECSEGSVWETALFASFHKLNNLVAIVDRNNIGALDYLSNFTSIEPFKKKWESFGWYVQEIDGHSIAALMKSLKKCNKSNKPNIIIAKTTKGKGIKLLENSPIWHVKKLEDSKDIQKAKKELDK